MEPAADLAGAPAPGSLWLARHALPVRPPGTGAPPQRPASACCYGHTDWPADPALTHQAATALAQALSTAHRPAGRTGSAAQPVAGLRVRCSPLRRCQQLADALAGLIPHICVQIDPRLAELHFGRWEGLPWDEVPRDELDAWAADFGTYRMGSNGETVQELLQRVSSVAHEAQTSDAPDTLWITHAGVIRAVHWLQERGWPLVPEPPQANAWPTPAPGYGGWCCTAWPARSAAEPVKKGVSEG